MTKQEARNLFMDYLYDEMDMQQKKEFETYLHEHPDLRKELEALTQTRTLLQFVPHETPSQKLVMVAPETGPKEHQRKKDRLFDLHPAVKTVFAIAASVLIILFGSALSGLQMGQTESGFYLSFGDQPVQTETGISEEEVYALIDRIRDENTLVMNSMLEHIQAQQTVQLEQAQAQQNDQLEEVLNTLTAYYEQQRRQDLRMISDGFTQLEEETNYRFLQTGEALGSIIYALSNP